MTAIKDWNNKYVETDLTDSNAHYNLCADIQNVKVSNNPPEKKSTAVTRSPQELNGPLQELMMA